MAQSIKFSVKHIKELLDPSWLSLSIDLLLLVVVTAVALAANLVKANTNDKFVVNYLLHAAGNSYSDLSLKLSNVRILNDLPLILFWIVVGIACWILVSNLIKSFTGAVETAEELNYAHVNRKNLEIEIITKFVIRLVTIALWYIYVRILIFKFLPFYFYELHKIINVRDFKNALDLALTVILFVLLLHINTVFIRMVALKRRLFGQLEAE